MRYQSRTYIQEPISCIRNKDHINVTMSSDICVFNKPLFDVDGADKIVSGMTSTDDGVHIIESSGTTIPLDFTFIENNDTLIDIDDITFKYRIYKYNNSISEFNNSALYTSSNVSYDDFDIPNGFSSEVPVNNLYLDGEYLIKGSYDFTMCTEYMNKLNEKIDTSIPVLGTEYGLYEPEFDFYFVAFTESITPIFSLSQEDTRTLGALVVESFEMFGETEVTTVNTWVGSPIVSLNGITLANTEDYTYIDNIITLLGDTVEGDIVMVAYVNNGVPNGLLSENIIVDGIILSGATGGQGSEPIYFDTIMGKYQIFTAADPIEFNDLIVTLNGITLVNGLDYYQLVGSPRTIVLNGIVYGSGDLGDGNIGGLADIITITYNSYGTYVGIIQVETFDVNWTVNPAPTSDDGKFTLIIAEDNTFTDIIFSGETQYVENQSLYTLTANINGYLGNSAAYKVVNDKNFTTLSGDILTSTSESEIIPIEISL